MGKFSSLQIIISRQKGEFEHMHEIENSFLLSRHGEKGLTIENMLERPLGKTTNSILFISQFELDDLVAQCIDLLRHTIESEEEENFDNGILDILDVSLKFDLEMLSNPSIVRFRK